MKKIFCLIIPTLFLAVAAPVRADGGLRNSKVTHVISGRALPSNARIAFADYSMKIHVVGRDLTQLSIELPEGLKVDGGVKVQDLSGKVKNPQVSSSQQKVLLSFSEPIPADTTLKIKLKNVKTPVNMPKTWLFPISARKVGLNSDIPLGLVQISTYD